MRILHILGELNPSGAEVMLKMALPFWESWGGRQQIISSNEKLGEYASDLENVGYEVFHLPMTSTMSFICWQRKLNLHIRKHQIDLVHIHTERHSLIKSLGVRLCGVPCVRTIHNVFDYNGLCKLQKVVERALARWVGVRQVTIGASVRNNENVVLKNPSVELANWMDDDIYCPNLHSNREEIRSLLGVGSDDVLLVSVGNGSDTKNYESIIKAMPILLEQDKFVYFQVGKPHPLGKDMDAARTLGVLNSVKFCGAQFNVRDYLWAADIYVMPSLYEGFSIAALEAVASGVPCVFADSPGLRDLKTDCPHIQWSGIDPDSITKAITQARSIDRNYCNKDSIVVREKYGKEAGARRYHDFWSRICEPVKQK